MLWSKPFQPKGKIGVRLGALFWLYSEQKGICEVEQKCQKPWKYYLPLNYPDARMVQLKTEILISSFSFG